MAFYQWLADGASEVTTSFVVLATVSLGVFGALLVLTGRLVVQAVKEIGEERRHRRYRSEALR